MFKVLTKGCEPTKGSKHSAAVDLFASEDAVVGAGETKLIGLGVCIDLDYHKLGFIFQNSREPYNEELNENKLYEFLNSHYLELHPRSSLRAKGLISNTGIIDLDYENEIKIIIHNPIKMEFNQGIPDRYIFRPFEIKKGDKIAQILLKEHKSYLLGVESDEERTGGFGSTGK